MVDFSLQAAHAGIPGWWQGCNLLITLRTLHNAHRWSQHSGHFLQFFYHCHHHVEVYYLCNTTTQWCFFDFLKPFGHFWCSWYWLQFNLYLFFKPPPSLGLNCLHCVQLDWSLLTCNAWPHKDFNAISLFILWPGSWRSLVSGIAPDITRNGSKTQLILDLSLSSVMLYFILFFLTMHEILDKILFNHSNQL